MAQQSSFFDTAWKLKVDPIDPVANRAAFEAEWERAQEAKRKRDAEKAQRESDERARREREFNERKEQYRRSRAGRASSSTFESPWVVLGIAVGATQDQIRVAWVRLVKKHHPDTGGNADIFRKVQTAYERLRA